MICFDSLGSRIYKVREETGLFYNAFGAFSAGATKEHGFDYLGSILSLDKLDQAEGKMLAVVKDLAENGITKNELNSAQQIYLKESQWMHQLHL